jgi:hypothetical protein
VQVHLPGRIHLVPLETRARIVMAPLNFQTA